MFQRSQVDLSASRSLSRITRIYCRGEVLHIVDGQSALDQNFGVASMYMKMFKF